MYIVMYVNMEDYCVSVGTNTTEFVRIPVAVFVLDHHTGLYLPLENFLVHKSLDTIGKMHSSVLFFVMIIIKLVINYMFSNLNIMCILFIVTCFKNKAIIRYMC
jgi:hypothetical protein